MAKPLMLPLTNKERKQMKRGKEVMKHFHDVVVPEDTVAVVVGKPWPPDKYNYLFQKGIDIIPIVLTDEQIDRLDSQALITTSTDPKHGFPVEVQIIATEEYEKWLKKNK